MASWHGPAPIGAHVCLAPPLVSQFDRQPCNLRVALSPNLHWWLNPATGGTSAQPHGSDNDANLHAVTQLAFVATVAVGARNMRKHRQPRRHQFAGRCFSRFSVQPAVPTAPHSVITMCASTAEVDAELESKRVKQLESFLEAQRQNPPTTDPLGEALKKYNDNPFDFMLIAVFRQVMSSVANWQSSLPFWGPKAYDGMLEVAHAQQWGKTLQETEDSSMAVIDNLLPESGKAQFRKALQPDKFGTELNAWITAVFFPFMVGKCTVEERTREEVPRIPEGEAWNCAIKIEKCRWLEKSGCVGMCVGLCKKPMERMFGEVLGMPLSMEPNMEDLSCNMVFGKDPEPWQQDELQQQPCFATCATAKKVGVCPKLS